MQAHRSTIDEGHWTDQLAMLRQRWRTLVATFVGFLSLALIWNYRIPAVYRATARLVIGATAPANALADRSSPIEGYLLERRSFETELEVMRSEPVARRAAEALGWIDGNTPPERVQTVVQEVKGALDVEHLRDTRIVLLHADAGAAERARDLCNAVADAYISYSQEQRDEGRRRSITWLTGELENQRDKLRRSEERLVDYLSTERLDFSGAEEAAPLSSEAADGTLRQEVTAAEIELVQLRRRYLDQHPKIVEARTRLESLRARLAQSQATREGEQRKLIQYRMLKRDADLDQQMYEVLLKGLKQADLSAGVVEFDLRVLESAKRPNVAIEPRTGRNLTVALVLGLCAAIAAAYLVDTLDRSVGSAEEVARVLGLSTLGTISRFDARPRTSSLVAEAPGALEGEMFRALRTNLRFSHVDLQRRAVLVTSTGPEEGKSTVLANLAVSLAQSGRRTVVIDTDLRRPTLHRMFTLAKTRGLADYLAGDSNLDEVLRPTHVEGLDALPCGTLSANPAELIESHRLGELVRLLRERYEYVLLDSPPAGGLVDASLLAGLVDGVLLVVEPRRFDWRVLRSTVRQLERSGARLYGVVLNKSPIDDQTSAYRYYSYGREATGDAPPASSGSRPT
ncbi:MAG TPA: polysaccharide biosynthesis tyrosine autokinase [Myxococcota bacterium]|nr:polysaccharide biosynthesis tyrosine autokinase [Myxococcota bacterium]